MILSVSRRTDIPAFYSKWFLKRLEEGYLYVRNPMYFNSVLKVYLYPEIVDCMIFWTKNPLPLMKNTNNLKKLKNYNYFFHFTITCYEEDVEQNLPDKFKSIIPTYKKLVDMIGKNRVIWRYDPILLNKKYNLDYHKKSFEKMCKQLEGYTDFCITSFLNFYQNTGKNTNNLGIIIPSISEKIEILDNLSSISRKYGITLQFCSDNENLKNMSIPKAKCIDQNLIEKIGKYKIKGKKFINQTKSCGCLESIDVGVYNTCINDCLYCYANYNKILANNNFLKHDVNSPFLFGKIEENDIIRENKTSLDKDFQIRLF